MTITATSTDPIAVTAPDPIRRGHGAGPADSRQDSPQGDHQSSALPWTLLICAVTLSLGSNVFAVLQLDHAARSFGGVVYGAWPTLAFLATAWLWHREARRGGRIRGGWRRGPLRSLLVWLLRLAVAVPAAYVSLLHVHVTALHFGQAGMMSWAEAIGMEAVTALALVELDAGIGTRGTLRQVDDWDQWLSAEVEEPNTTDEAGPKREALAASIIADHLAGTTRSAKEYAEEHRVSRQYAGRIRNDLEKSGALT